MPAENQLPVFWFLPSQPCLPTWETTWSCEALHCGICFDNIRNVQVFYLNCKNLSILVYYISFVNVYKRTYAHKDKQADSIQWTMRMSEEHAVFQCKVFHDNHWKNSAQGRHFYRCVFVQLSEVSSVRNIFITQNKYIDRSSGCGNCNFLMAHITHLQSTCTYVWWHNGCNI